MLSNKFGRLIFGLYSRKRSAVCGVIRSCYSWTAVCKQRTLWLQKSACLRTQQHAVPCPVSLRSVSQTTVDPDEPLGRLGASVLGIDPVEDSIGTAQLHSSYDPDLRDRVCYRACTLEELSAEEEEEGGEEEQGAGQFDAVVASEVVEHLADLETFAFCCSHVLKPGGSLFITTINKTNLSYALGIVIAEQLLRIVPSGTHDWEKFISPVELERLLESNGFSVQSVQGMLYNPVSGAWSWTNSTAINYALHAVKVRDEQAGESGSGPEEDTAATHS